MKQLLYTSLFTFLSLGLFAQSNVTFGVDMSNYTSAFTTVYVSGTFNGWDGAANPLTDNGDGTWSATLSLADGDYEFKYQVDQWAADEMLEPGSDCTMTTDNFTNRVVTVAGDTDTGISCWGSCEACVPPMPGNITIHVDMSQYEGSFTTVFLSGAFNGWGGNSNPMEDADGDGVWSVTVMMPAGANEYKFQLDEWTNEEMFAGGESCTVTSPDGMFTNRVINVNGDAEISAVCFNSCAPCAGDGGCISILDYESAETSVDFAYFGSTLDQLPTTTVANPNPTGINTSANVVEYVKAAGAEVWAGAFGDPPTEINVVGGNQVCIKVHSDHVGNLALKLEASSTNGPNWIQQLPIETANEWVELCFDTNLPSFEDPMAPAAGHVYSRAVVFFDFGIAGTDSDQVFYFDDLQVCGGGEQQPVDVTFQVNTSEVTESFDGVLLRGSFNGWDESTAMTDNGDGTWSVTLTLDIGTYEYKFYLAGADIWEEFSPFEECVVSTDGFTNRLVVVSATETLDAVCFNSCYTCGDAALITINVGTSEIEVSPEGIFLAGGGNFGAPGDFPMSDDDGDGVFTISFSRQIGFASFYTFTNGACADFSCKEDISGQSCANPDNFNDRLMDTSGGDLEINTCFAECSETTECGGGNMFADGTILFSVDMAEYSENFTEVFVSGTFNGWDGAANPMTDADGDGIWEASIAISGGVHEFKFQLDNWNAQEEFAGGEACTVTSPDGMFTNRALTVDGDATLGTVCFNECAACMVGTNNLLIDNNMFNIQPTLVQHTALVNFDETLTYETKILKVYNAIGELMMEEKINPTVSQTALKTVNLTNGIYFVNVQTEEKIGTRKIVVNK